MAKLKPNQFILSGHLITELPILYQTEMVRAILADRKKQTRRTTKSLLAYCKKYDPKEFFEDLFTADHLAFFSISTEEVSQWENPVIRSPYGMPGDLLWVRENWFLTQPCNPEEYRFGYQAGGVFRYSDWEASEKYDYSEPDKLRPSIHMPKEASRIWLMVEDIRVERLQDISEADAIAEGIEPIDQHGVSVWKRYDGYYTVTSKPYVSFWSLWAAINGDESWNSNPWVWVIKFRVLSKTGRPSDAAILENYLEVTGKEVTNV